MRNAAGAELCSGLQRDLMDYCTETQLDSVICVKLGHVDGENIFWFSLCRSAWSSSGQLAFLVAKVTC